MQIFQFLIIPQYVVAGVLVPLHGLPACLDTLAWAMPLRYAVGLMRASFYAGTPGYGQVLVGSPLLDAVVMGGLFVVLLTVGVFVFDYRERTR
jgi:ABC-2 type transport system permease protein